LSAADLSDFIKNCSLIAVDTFGENTVDWEYQICGRNIVDVRVIRKLVLSYLKGTFSPELLSLKFWALPEGSRVTSVPFFTNDVVPAILLI